MKWYYNLFLGEKITPKYKQTVLKIKNREFTPNVYLITLASNPKNLLDILSAEELIQNRYPKTEIFVIGLAQGKKEAFEVTRQIVDEVYQKTGNTNVREYLTQSTAETVLWL